MFKIHLNNFMTMSKNSSKGTAAAKRKSTTAAPQEQSESRNAKLDWDYEHTKSFKEICSAIGCDGKAVKVGFNKNSDGEKFPVIRLKATKKAVLNKLPDAAREYVAFACSMNMSERMEANNEDWDLDYVKANARSFGFITHPNDGFAGIGKLCLQDGDYEIADLSDLLEDEDDE